MPKLTSPTSRPLRRAVVAGAFLGSAVAALLVCSTALALWSQIVSAGPQTLSTLALVAPSGLSSTASGHDVVLAWSAGVNGTGYVVKGVANGSSSNCTSASFASLGTSATTSYTDSGRFSPQGTYFCYQALTSRGNWTSVSGNPTTAAQLGFVATSATVSGAGSTFVFTFNQAVATASGPSGSNSVCFTSTGTNTIMLGSTTSTGNCSSSETLKLGRLTGGTNSSNARYAATYAWSNSNKTLTVSLGSRTSGNSNPTKSGTWTFTPTTTAANMVSTAGSFHVCDTNSGGGNCLPTLSGSF